MCVKGIAGSTDAEILYFGPGTYWMGSDAQAELPPTVRWVYLAPGAVVKGAFHFTKGAGNTERVDYQTDYRVTGYGALSGEQYVYEADTANGFKHKAADNCHTTCVKPLYFHSVDAQQKLTLQGVTIKEPSYHSFVVYGNEDAFAMDVSNYQQVGAWYWQTDGLELYTGSTMRSTFFHANDDVLKLDHSNVSVKDTVVWKGQNGPVVQWGWEPRNIDGVSVDGTAVIHNRMFSRDVAHNTCVFNSSTHWNAKDPAPASRPVAPTSQWCRGHRRVRDSEALSGWCRAVPPQARGPGPRAEPRRGGAWPARVAARGAGCAMMGCRPRHRTYPGLVERAVAHAGLSSSSRLSCPKEDLMRLVSRRSMLGGSAALAVAATLAACGDSASSDQGGVYFLNFKPEAEEAFKAIAEAYKTKTGVEVKVVTAAAGKYEETLTSEVAKSAPPTLFNINGPVGLANWKDYATDLSDTDAAKALTDGSLALKGDDGKIYGVPLATEGYGIIYNKAILDKYFAMEGAKAASVDEIKGFAKLKEVVEDIQAKKAELGISGAFAATSLSPGEDWRFQTHLANYPVFYELRDLGATDSNDLKLTYSDNYKQIFDLYLNNSTIAPTEASAKAVTDSMAEFALGQCAFVQNGNWAWSQISEVEGNTVKEEDIHFLPIYVGVEGEEKYGIALGTENYLTINSEASDAAKQDTQAFLNWLLTDAEAAKMLVDNSVVSVSPYSAFSSLAPADPLGKEIVSYLNNDALSPVNWVFQTFPSQEFKDQLGQHLSQYASGKEDWSAVKDYFVTGWAEGKAKA